ncbi:hypothetical protein K438DRAFT_1768192 [Mycena galopus ATCC 62051]|nr:hypothetical protein K438DRAFT_1768192 [Mycena galopus ATCC 62051]
MYGKKGETHKGRRFKKAKAQRKNINRSHFQKTAKCEDEYQISKLMSTLDPVHKDRASQTGGYITNEQPNERQSQPSRDVLKAPTIFTFKRLKIRDRHRPSRPTDGTKAGRPGAVRRRYGGAASLARLDGTGRWTGRPSTVDGRSKLGQMYPWLTSRLVENGNLPYVQRAWRRMRGVQPRANNNVFRASVYFRVSRV